MLFYARYYGQLCNHLFALIPAYTFALKHGTTLNLLYAREDYVDLFPNLRTAKGIRVWRANKYTNKYVGEILDFLLKREIHGELRNTHHNPFVIRSIYGREHCADKSFILDYKSQIVNTFAFSDDVKRKVAKVIDGFDGVTVGVHIRRGDYKTWLSGKYYYDDATYIRTMDSLFEQFSKRNINCRFLICSNEPFSAENKEYEILRIQDADAITDLCALSMCDYIVGPTSSFSQWASFIGEVPLYVLLSKDDVVDVNKFSRIVLLDTFEDGRLIKWSDDRIYIE